jgi:uncharacterized protein YbaR (Trm112 family)
MTAKHERKQVDEKEGWYCTKCRKNHPIGENCPNLWLRGYVEKRA